MLVCVSRSVHFPFRNPALVGLEDVSGGLAYLDDRLL